MTPCTLVMVKVQGWGKTGFVWWGGFEARSVNKGKEGARFGLPVTWPEGRGTK